MVNMKFLLVTFLIISLNIYARDITLTTYDQTFRENYSAEIMIAGDETNYPNVGDTVKFNFEAWATTSETNWFYPNSDQPPVELVLGSEKSFNCWDNVISRMSVGEKIRVFCKSYDVLGGKGNSFIPADRDVRFYITLVSFERGNNTSESSPKPAENITDKLVDL